MENIVCAKYDMDSGCVYAGTENCNLILIDCEEAEKAYADNMYERSQINYLLGTDPEAYAELIWDQNPRAYLKTVTEYYLAFIPAVKQ